MLSESARVTTAAESRFRVRTPNAQPRAVAVVALDDATAALAAELAGRAWRGTTFFTAPAEAAPDRSVPAGSFSRWLRTITGQAIDLADEVARVDAVQMLLTAGQDAPAGSLIGDACLLQGVKTSGLVIDDPGPDGHGADAAALSRSLRALRPWVMTLSVISSAEYVDDILHALGG